MNRLERRDIRAANSLMQSIRSAIRGLQRWIADLNEKKKTHMKEIVSIMLNTVGKRTKQQMSIRLNAGEDVKDFLVEKGYDEKYGARPLRRTIQNLVEDKLAEAVLEGRVREGDSVKLLLKDGQLKFSARHPQTARKQDGVVV